MSEGSKNIRVSGSKVPFKLIESVKISEVMADEDKFMKENESRIHIF